MTIRLEAFSDKIEIFDPECKLALATRSTLRLYGFTRSIDGFIGSNNEREEKVLQVFDLLTASGVGIEIDSATEEIIKRRDKAHSQLMESRKRGAAVKAANLSDRRKTEFLEFLSNKLHRRLLLHQVKAAIHLINVIHGANFSIPGAGKTSVVLAVYEFLYRKDSLNCLFVVGPRSCFMPWRTEFELTLGRAPRFEILAGGEVEERHRRYYPRAGDEAELYLTTYQTLSRDKQQVQHLLQNHSHHAFFVVDEAHYMKQDDGIWANAVAETGKYAKRRCVLTGTPFPKSYADGINQFDVLHPNSGIFSPNVRRKIRYLSESGKHREARTLLEPKIDSLYYRVRKSELGLSKPVFFSPIQVNMNSVERELYNCIEKRIGQLEKQVSDHDLGTILKLKKGRQIRRRQATSYCALLVSAIGGYDEVLIDSGDDNLNQKILNYDQLETPAKVERLLREVQHLYERGEKVVIWANFVGTLRKIKKEFDRTNLESRIIYGGTPLEDEMDEESREMIIEMFKDCKSGLDILIANPAACAESISLHKTCSNAIYYDLSYNCAEYLQSLDRIHRVGGSESKTSYYRFLQYTHTFESEILDNLTEKALRMADVIDQDFPLAFNELEDLGIEEDGIFY